MNKYQTEFTEDYLKSLPDEIREQYYDFVTNIPYIQNIIKDDRKYARDLPKDLDGKIIIDVTQPHILEDMDYFRPTALHYQKFGCFTKLKPNSNPNSEYGKWLKEEVRRCWEGYVRPSDGEWITGDMYFFINYCPIQLIKKDAKGKSIRTLDFPKVWDGHYYKYHYLNQCRNSGHHAAELASRGKGKAHPYDTAVWTPEGKKKWGDIHKGDLLFDTQGGTTEVLDIPFDGIAPIYKMFLSSGAVVRSSEGHLWKVYNMQEHKEEILTTKDIYLNKLNKYIIPLSEEVEFPEKEVFIEPYVMGLLLSDTSPLRIINGSLQINLSTSDYKSLRENCNYDFYVTPDDKLAVDLDCLQKRLEYYSLGRRNKNKAIPEDYKINSVYNRTLLLKGILDADGVIDRGRIALTSSSYNFMQDINWLCASLGIATSQVYQANSKYSFVYRGYSGKCTKPKVKVRNKTIFKIFIYPKYNLFSFEDKKVFWDKSSKSHAYRSWSKGYKIQRMAFVGNKRCKCVTVDSDDHCYLIEKFITTHNSYTAAELLAKRFILGESDAVKKKVQCVATASERKYLQGANQLLDMFQYYIDFCANNTEFPRQRITSSLQNLAWTMGYVDSETNTRRGTENSVIGITSKDDESKLRGSRGVLYLIEEAGTFPRLLNLYQVLRPSVEDGKSVFGLIYLYGTCGDNASDFSSMQELMYNPEGYNIMKLSNVYDKEGQGRKYFTYFFPGYMNRAECYDDNGNSDVTKALMEILLDRYKVKYNSTDINAITKRIAEIPVTPQEAILRTQGNIFPVTDLTQRLAEIDNDPSFYDDTYVGTLTMDRKGEVTFKLDTSIKPIREFPLKDSTAQGALEIYEMPQKVNDKVPSERYILSLDNVENDQAQSLSLGSILVLDLWTDRIVAEYTGRPMFADDLNELCRKMCLFYNGRVMVENNKKNTFAYFSRMNSLHLMADTPEYLKNRQLIKTQGFGNSTKGISATVPIKNFAMTLLKDWLLKPVTEEKEIDGKVETYTTTNLHYLKNRAFIKELMLYNPAINVDRIMSACQLMMYREEKMILYQGDMRKPERHNEDDYLGNDDFFKDNYQQEFTIQ